MTSVSKPFTIHIDPEPTFQGLLWKEVSKGFVPPGTTGFTSTPDTFNMLTDAVGGGGVAILHENGGDGTIAGSLSIPSVAHQRNCNFHIDVTNSISPQIVAGDTGFVLHYNATTIVAAPTALGSYDYPFVLLSGVAYTFRLELNMHVAENGGHFAALTWAGSIYVVSYT